MNDFVEYSELYHHGIKGMRWGIRRYQNADGTLTPEGKRRYFNPDGSLTREGQKNLNKRFGVGKHRLAAGLGLASAGAGAFNLLAGRYNSRRFLKAANSAYANRVKQLSGDFIKGWNSKSSMIPSSSQIKKFSENIAKMATKDPKYRYFLQNSIKFKNYAKTGAIALGVGAAVAGIALYKNHKNKKRLEQNGRQYIELMRTGKMQANKSDSAVTKRVKNDYNNLTDQQFMNKYYGSKSTYLNRVNKYGDPYKNGILPKIGKALAKSRNARIDKQISALEKSKDYIPGETRKRKKR